MSCTTKEGQICLCTLANEGGATMDAIGTFMAQAPVCHKEAKSPIAKDPSYNDQIEATYQQLMGCLPGKEYLVSYLATVMVVQALVRHYEKQKAEMDLAKSRPIV